MRFGNVIALLRQAGFAHLALNTPEAETAEIEVLVTHPTLGKCPAIPHPYLSPRRSEDARLESDWRSGFLVINQDCPKQTSL